MVVHSVWRAVFMSELPFSLNHYSLQIIVRVRALVIGCSIANFQIHNIF